MRRRPLAERIDRLCSEPHRLFFPLGVLAGTAGAGHWLFYGFGWSAGVSGFYHSSVQVWLFMGAFAFGFLGTFIPRFSGTPPASRSEMALFLCVYALMAAALFTGQWITAETSFVLWMLSVAAFAARRLFASRMIKPLPGFVWLPFGWLMGACGCLLLILGETRHLPPQAMTVGRAMEEQGFMLSLVTGIGSFLGPRLMGVPLSFTAKASSYKRKVMLHAAAAAAFSLSFLAESTAFSQAAYGLRALIVTVVLREAKALPLSLPKGSAYFRKLVQLAFFLTAAGVWAPVVFFGQRVTSLHVLYLGGFSLMIFTFATMVVVGHSGRSDSLQKPLWILPLLPVGILSALGICLLAGWVPELYAKLLAVSSAVWIATSLAWLFFCGSFLWQEPFAEAVERELKLKTSPARPC